MKRWGPSDEAIAQADLAPWAGLFASQMRPFTYRSLRRVGVATGLMYLLGGMAGVIAAVSASRIGANAAGMTAVVACAFAVALAMLPASTLLQPTLMRRFAPTFGLVGIFTAGPLVSLGLLAAGPRLSTFAAVYVEAPIFAFYMLRRRWAVLSVALIAIEFALVLAVQHGVADPVAHWLTIMSTVTATAVLVGGIAQRADELTASEHRARVDLADINRTLEERVTAQVAELASLGRLRRFLSPQVADAVLSGGSESLLRPHRRKIAVFFCDLRGFTAFTNQAEPEQVVEVLDEYYKTVGGLLRTHNATIGGYAGDGIMAYFGDPVSSEAPAHDAVRMAASLRRSMSDLVRTWEGQGFALNYGVGIAYGYATLGVVGFDGRYDYTPLGAVVNLAARLCSHAEAGQVMLDQATHANTNSDYPSIEGRVLELKGYSQPIQTYLFAAEQVQPVLR